MCLLTLSPGCVRKSTGRTYCDGHRPRRKREESSLGDLYLCPIHSQPTDAKPASESHEGMAGVRDTTLPRDSVRPYDMLKLSGGPINSLQSCMASCRRGDAVQARPGPRA